MAPGQPGGRGPAAPDTHPLSPFQPGLEPDDSTPPESDALTLAEPVPQPVRCQLVDAAVRGRGAGSHAGPEAGRDAATRDGASTCTPTGLVGPGPCACAGAVGRALSTAVASARPGPGAQRGVATACAQGFCVAPRAVTTGVGRTEVGLSRSIGALVVAHRGESSLTAGGRAR